MTYEEAMTMLVNHQAWARSESHRYADAVDVAIECIEKQISRKPTLQNNQHEKCPNCGSFIIMEYCANCGQKIDWSEEE